MKCPNPLIIWNSVKFHTNWLVGEIKYDRFCSPDLSIVHCAHHVHSAQLGAHRGAHWDYTCSNFGCYGEGSVMSGLSAKSDCVWHLVRFVLTFLCVVVFVWVMTPSVTISNGGGLVGRNWVTGLKSTGMYCGADVPSEGIPGIHV